MFADFPDAVTAGGGARNGRLRALWPFGLSALVAISVVVYVAATLGNSSLWLDELMSVYYSDPSHLQSGTLWRTMSSDLHPPGYYILLFAWREIFGNSVVSVRALSTVLMVLVLAIFTRHVWRRFGPRIAALCLPVVAVSHIFVVYAQEVRGYALLMLFGLASAIVYERTCSSEARLTRTLPALVVLCFLTETIHPYGVLWAGSVCAGLLVYRRTLNERMLVVAAGLLLLIFPVARFAWLTELASDNYNWFAYLNPAVELAFGLARPLFVREDLWLAVPVVACAAWWLLSRQIDWKTLRAAAPLALLVPLVVGMALAVHYAVEPSFNDRNLIVIAPVLWLLLPHAVASVRDSRPNHVIVVAAVVLLTGNHALHSGWLARGFKSEWRASAAFVDTFYDRCRGTPIPVFGYTTPDRDSYFYRYYLHHDFEFRFVDRKDVSDVLATVPAGGCPIKFWAPHGLASDVVATKAELDAFGYRLASFDHAAQWQRAELAGAFVIYRDDSESD